ncbi:MAG: methionyl-tRNA formyltransferase, partial [Proteobacteria bacterium]|nr:methionyl-tRNA formyltransferase [Pseudomonadota bacterium]
SGHDIVAVYTQPPRPAGRGQKERPCPVERAAREYGIPVRTPKNFRDDVSRREFAALGLDVAVVAAYGLILPKEILISPKLGCINIHASLLPRWRGAAPIQRAIVEGDSESGITIMQMDEGLDTGPMLLTGTVPITPETTGESLHDALSALGTELIITALQDLEAGTLKPIEQPNHGETYAKKLNTSESKLDWRLNNDRLERQIRAFTPWPGSWFELNGERIKIMTAVCKIGAGEPGTVLDDCLTIACGVGALRPLSLQRAGKRVMAAEEFLRGSPMPAGTLLP